jgi:hypothetical protein
MKTWGKVVLDGIEYFRGPHRYEDWFYYVNTAYYGTRRKQQRVYDPTLKAALHAADAQAHGAAVASEKTRRQHSVEAQWEKEAKLSLTVLARKIYNETVKPIRDDFVDICGLYGLHCYTSQPTGVQWIREPASGAEYRLADYWQVRLK